MYYYKTILPNNEIFYFTSFNFCKYVSENKEFRMCFEQDAQYVLLKDEYYRIPWLKFEPKEIMGKYPIINTEFVEEDEYNSFIQEMSKQ